MRVAVVGAGLAGAALAWRLTRRGAQVEIFAPRGPYGQDATNASGGLVRGFEPDPLDARRAAWSLAELRADPVLRAWAGYRELPSVYALPPDADPGAAQRAVDAVDELIPGSARLRQITGPAELPALPGLAVGTLAVQERYAGYISPGRLRSALLAAALAGGARLLPEPVTGVDPAPAVRVAGGAEHRCDALVVATGPWTPPLLARWGLPGQGLRTRQIQYTLGRAEPPGLGAFVDDSSGLYGRVVGAGLLLLGLPTRHWQVVPGGIAVDTALAREVVVRAGERLGLVDWPGAHARTVASADCYAGEGGLRLRRLLPDTAVHTFTGGSGGAAKTVLTAAHDAAAELCPRAARGTRA
ncbi:FAD-dependent oxidoreductase [Streptomyces sp. 8L]|uniref:FAD-dependent oxidoreductase n=1 Tax=Streptomyces sp. 8L TaxID=2877242 RepID=UPI001CD50E8F|nr:FAD-dependent oxidoreductase [Streptomyces sp. 8L]MCA1222132.1 FAD-dependent oxidoreductase [Streptomyces sp. 8L]